MGFSRCGQDTSTGCLGETVVIYATSTATGLWLSVAAAPKGHSECIACQPKLRTYVYLVRNVCRLIRQSNLLTVETQSGSDQFLFDGEYGVAHLGILTSAVEDATGAIVSLTHLDSSVTPRHTCEQAER